MANILESRERWVEAERAFESVKRRTSDDRVLRRSTLGLANALYALQRNRQRAIASPYEIE